LIFKIRGLFRQNHPEVFYTVYGLDITSEGRRLFVSINSSKSAPDTKETGLTISKGFLGSNYFSFVGYPHFRKGNFNTDPMTMPRMIWNTKLTATIAGLF